MRVSRLSPTISLARVRHSAEERSRSPGRQRPAAADRLDDRTLRNIELPEVRSRRADMLGETAEGRLVHIELQSTNDPQMALRMAEYALAICREFTQLPDQLVLYVGEAPLRMTGSLKGPMLRFDCRIADIRELDAEPLLASISLDDNIMAILARFKDEKPPSAEFWAT